MRAWQAEWLEALDVTRAMEHVRWLTVNTPRRVSGTGDDSVAAEYIATCMRRWGLEVTLQEFPAYNSLPGDASLRVIEPVDKPVPCVACAHIAATPPDGLEAELVYVGAGGETDYQGVDVRGKVVMAEVSYAPATPEKARIAVRQGAAGMVLVNWGESSCDQVSMRALKAVWGNPTPQTWGLMPEIPAVSVSRASGEHLISLCRAGRVRVWMRADCRRFWAHLRQPVGVLPGKRWPDQFVLVSGHLDAWEPGVTCNATGNGVLLEIARALASTEEGPGRSVYFAFWNGHEIAEAAGSTWFLDTHWDLVRDGCVAYLNIDSPGLKGAKHYRVSASPELAGFALQVARETLAEPVRLMRLTKTGDQSFFGAGVPSITGRYCFDERTLEATHGASLGWWNHTSADTLDKVDESSLARELKVNAAFVAGLADAEVLPYDPMAVVDDARDRLAACLDLGPGLGLCAVMDALAALRLDAEVLRRAAASPHAGLWAEAINRGMILLSRCLTSAFRTGVSRWDQDMYGSSVLSMPVPLLAEPEAIPCEGKEARYLVETSLRRARNRLSDSVFMAREVLRHICDSVRFSPEHGRTDAP